MMILAKAEKEGRKMRFFGVFLLLQFCLFAYENGDLNATKNEWVLERVNFYFENDIYTKTDDGYTAGERLSFLYYVPNDYALYNYVFPKSTSTESYFTIALTNQIFTPSDTDQIKLIVNDRPYAGWSYLDFGIHQSSNDTLHSLTLKVGLVGETSKSKEIQNGFHEIIGNDEVKGWDNQLNNEIGINLKYTYKWLYDLTLRNDFESSVIPFASAEFGNVAINATLGTVARFGWNIPRDFGVSSIDIGADPGIPICGQCERKTTWSFSFNMTLAGSVIARDIFLDGNTFSESHSVEKENFVYYSGLGFTLRYKKFIFDFIEIYNSKKFKLEKGGHGVGTLVCSWRF